MLRATFKKVVQKVKRSRTNVIHRRRLMDSLKKKKNGISEEDIVNSMDLMTGIKLLRKYQTKNMGSEYLYLYDWTKQDSFFICF